MFKYSLQIKWSDEDNGCIATAPELPGLSAFGKTQEEAVSELKIAAEAYLEALKESGQAIPVPEKMAPYSGQIRLRMPKSLHAKLAAAAATDDISLNTYIVSLLSERQGEREALNLFRTIIEKGALSPEVQKSARAERAGPRGSHLAKISMVREKKTPYK
jgi:predicted RNase H-like HicB family nuclease